LVTAVAGQAVRDAKRAKGPTPARQRFEVCGPRHIGADCGPALAISRRLTLRIGSVNAASAPGQRISIRPTRLPTRIWLDSGRMSVSADAARRKGCHADRDQVNVAGVQEATAKVDAMAVEPETIVTAKCDLLSPNALGAILDDDTTPSLHACVTAGAAASRPGAEWAV
jgi:hypothetical protein